jgi:hypothetical protein
MVSREDGDRLRRLPEVALLDLGIRPISAPQ